MTAHSNQSTNELKNSASCVANKEVS